jgi:hypothetical protein
MNRQPTEVQRVVAADITARLRHAQCRRALLFIGTIELRLYFPGTLDYGMDDKGSVELQNPVLEFQRKLGDKRGE